MEPRCHPLLPCKRCSTRWVCHGFGPWAIWPCSHRWRCPPHSPHCLSTSSCPFFTLRQHRPAHGLQRLLHQLGNANSFSTLISRHVRTRTASRKKHSECPILDSIQTFEDLQKDEGQDAQKAPVLNGRCLTQPGKCFWHKNILLL